MGKLKKEMEQAMIGVYRAFGRELPPRIINMMDEDLFSRDTLDFGRLNEEAQTAIIRTLASSRGARSDMIARNLFLGFLEEGNIGGTENEELIGSNGKIVRFSYGRKRISEILLDTYRQVMEQQVIQKISRPALLDLYLDPLRFSLVGLGATLNNSGKNADY
jgi:hypothetical protein